MDFISVGSNDLTQYLLAVDRPHSEVSVLYDSLHPAVLQALNTIVKAVHAQGKTVSICAEMVNDPLALIVLLGLGFDSVSLDYQYLPIANQSLSEISLKKARIIVTKILQMDRAEDIRLYLQKEKAVPG